MILAKSVLETAPISAESLFNSVLNSADDGINFKRGWQTCDLI